MNVDATKRLYDLGREIGERGNRWCYIAGPMRSKPGHNYEAFNGAAKTLRDYGWHVFNPAETDAEVRTEAEKAPNPLSVYMQQDLVDVCKSDVVFVLDGWEESEGAQLEVTVADHLDIPVYAFPQIVRADEAELNDESDLPRRILDYVKPNGEPTLRDRGKPSEVIGRMGHSEHLAALRPTKKFDHDKGHLVDSLWPRVYGGNGTSYEDRSKATPATSTYATGVPSNDIPVHPFRGPDTIRATPRQFSSGATRNPDTNKPDFEGFISPLVVEEFGRYMHEHRLQADGTQRNSDNWQKGMPLPEYMKSMWRHFLHVWLLHRGHEATDYDTGEPVTLTDALCGVKFNVDGYLFEVLKAEATEGVDAVTRTG